MNNTFNIARTVQLMKHDVINRYKTIFITALTIIALLALFPDHVTGTDRTYLRLLFIGGFIVTSMIFKELGDSRRATFYLTLPVSNFERLFSKWFLTSIGFALATLVLYCFFSILSALVGLIVFNQTREIFNPFYTGFWVEIGKYVILHSVIFLGAVTFKRNALIKTALCVTAFFLVVSMSMALFTYIFCSDCFVGGITHLLMSSSSGTNFIFWVILAPFCWFVSYLKLTEVEIR